MAEETLPRFQLLDDDKMQDLINSADSPNTKNSVKYSMKIFEDFLQVINTDLDSVNKLSNSELDNVLQKFYAGARRKNGSYYMKKSMLAIRFGLQRHFLNCNKVDIIKHEDFSNSTRVFKCFSAMLKEGKGVVTHKPAISAEDMDKIQSSLDLNDPVGLQDKKSPSVTASSSDKATHLQTMQQNTSVTSKSNTGVNEGTMTDLTWIELLRKLVQSKDASTQWEKQPPTHSTQAASTSSTQDLDKPSCGDDGELEQDGLGWSSQDTPAGQEDEFMDSSEPSDLHIDLSTIVAGYRGFEEETTVAESQEGEQNNSPILRRIKEEMIDEFEEEDYQTLYVKEEYLEDECQDDDYAHVHLTPGGRNG
ncbi:uncharacterized protein LOC105446798 isoform X2 [Strongylocentrotus purpuratus]|uniref:Uncharacterized protein n=1 Tax=Strongylocentrotus purpuratus TaxID=7668 RepID=A0A7M7SX76_STRPU|nr:uncharacterized protein LOC105446798 isoform X2 [Strongylocentrotus purpuratus]